ncbi:MAG: hypothetical protein M1822_005601 [Bathelium mastoideum]|nr:MAG: hypothetical protein M1822_005601 [Bathelium mastoideum]
MKPNKKDHASKQLFWTENILTNQKLFYADLKYYNINMMPMTHPRPTPKVPMPAFIPLAAEGGVDVGALPIRLPELADALVEVELELELLLEVGFLDVVRPFEVLGAGVDEKEAASEDEDVDECGVEVGIEVSKDWVLVPITTSD